MNSTPSPGIGPLSEGQQMRLRIAARHLDEFRQSNLGTAPPAAVVQTAQRLATTVGDLLSMVQDLAQRLPGAPDAAPRESPPQGRCRNRP